MIIIEHLVIWYQGHSFPYFPATLCLALVIVQLLPHRSQYSLNLNLDTSFYQWFQLKFYPCLHTFKSLYSPCSAIFAFIFIHVTFSYVFWSIFVWVRQLHTISHYVQRKIFLQVILNDSKLWLSQLSLILLFKTERRLVRILFPILYLPLEVMLKNLCLLDVDWSKLRATQSRGGCWRLKSLCSSSACL